ncbi:MAG: EamA family transporter [Sulfurovum sp.]
MYCEYNILIFINLYIFVNCGVSSFSSMIFMLFVDSETIYLTKTVIFYSFLSGSITSAIGYLMWYLVLPKIEINTAGILQLFVPLIAIIISVLILDEVFTLTLLISTILIVFGVLISFKKKVKV